MQMTSSFLPIFPPPQKLIWTEVFSLLFIVDFFIRFVDFLIAFQITFLMQLKADLKLFSC